MSVKMENFKFVLIHVYYRIVWGIIMGLATSEENELINELDKCDSIGYGLNPLESFMIRNNDKITNLYNNGKINDDTIDSLIIRKLIAETRLYINKMVETRNTDYPLYAQDVPRTEFLAYVIDNNIFTEDFMKKIMFSFNGLTLKSFAEKYKKKDVDMRSVDLIAEVRKELLNPSPEKILKYCGASERNCGE